MCVWQGVEDFVATPYPKSTDVGECAALGFRITKNADIHNILSPSIVGTTGCLGFIGNVLFPSPYCIVPDCLLACSLAL